MNDVTAADIRDLLTEQGQAFETFVKKNDNRFSVVEKELGELCKKANRPPIGFGGGSPAPQTKHASFIEVKSGRPIPVLAHDEKLSSHVESAGYGTSIPTMGRVLRGICTGGNAPDAAELAEERKAMSLDSDPSGGYTATGALASQWIDALRAQSVLSRAGVLTLPMETGELGIAVVTGDPMCGWHGEGGNMPLSTPTFGRLNLKAKTIACVVRISLELAQDAANIEQQLSKVITAAMAGAIDAAGLTGVNPNSTDATTDGSGGLAAGPTGIFDLAGRNTVTSIGAPTSWDFVVDGMYELLLDNVPQENIGALVGHPAVWKKLRKLKTGISSDNTPLTMPAEVAALPKYWTTAAPLSASTAKCVMGNWADMIMGIRQGITVRVLSATGEMHRALQLVVLAYARVDFGVARPKSFVTLEGITVS